jgi:hypothetical protein
MEAADMSGKKNSGDTAKMFVCTVSVGDYDFSTPKEAAEAMMRWLREDQTDVFVDVEDQDTGERTQVRVPGRGR